MVQLAVLSIALHHVTVQFDHMSKQKLLKVDSKMSMFTESSFH